MQRAESLAWPWAHWASSCLRSCGSKIPRTRQPAGRCPCSATSAYFRVEALGMPTNRFQHVDRRGAVVRKASGRKIFEDPSGNCLEVCYLEES